MLPFLKYNANATPGKRPPTTETTQIEKRKNPRKFNEDWRKGRGWLQLSNDGKMFCSLCRLVAKFTK